MLQMAATLALGVRLVYPQPPHCVALCRATTTCAAELAASTTATIWAHVVFSYTKPVAGGKPVSLSGTAKTRKGRGGKVSGAIPVTFSAGAHAQRPPPPRARACTRVPNVAMLCGVPWLLPS